MRSPLCRAALLTLPALALAACVGQGGEAADSLATARSRADSQVTPDSIPEERPDTIKLAPPDSTTMLLSLLPAAPEPDIGGEAGSMGERAVFAPRTQRWFMARVVDSALAMDIGRIDGGVGTTDAAKAAFQRMVAALSPLQPGMPLTLHTASGAVATTITGYRLAGRRIVADRKSVV